MDDEDLNAIIKAIESRKCLIFIGAGASTAYRDHAGREVAGLPAGGALAESLAQQCNYVNGSTYDLLKVSEYFVYSDSGDRSNLEKALRKTIQSCNKPRPIHSVLAQITKVRYFVTTNYDTLLEREFDHYNRTLYKHVYDRTASNNQSFTVLTEPEEGDVVLHKMHGCIEAPQSMVITESDYIEYLANLIDSERGMPSGLRTQIIPNYTLLFLGYGLGDWNFRVIWQGVVARLANKQVRKLSYALALNPTRQFVDYWRDQRVKVINKDLTDFAKKLAAHFNLAIPQLDIERRDPDFGR